MRLKLGQQVGQRSLHRRGKGAGFSDEIETLQAPRLQAGVHDVVRARGSQMRLKRN